VGKASKFDTGNLDSTHLAIHHVTDSYRQKIPLLTIAYTSSISLSTGSVTGVPSSQTWPVLTHLPTV
jgi:hypothetical protein